MKIYLIIFFFSFFAQTSLAGCANPYSTECGKMPSVELSLSLEQMRLLGEDMVNRSRFEPPRTISYWSQNPTLGFFPFNGTSHIIWVNGLKLDLRNCSDVNSLKTAVAKNQHRQISGLKLPAGYDFLFPENIEEISRTSKCGAIKRLKQFLK